VIAAAPVLTQLFLNCASVLGLLTLYRVLGQRGSFDPINRRFRFVLRVTMLLFAGRILVSVTGIEGFRSFILLGAALIPLAVLVLTEGLLRRHAPFFVKVLISLCAVVFGASAAWFSESIDPARLVGLLVYQVVGFALVGLLIVRRDRGSLSARENLMVVRLGWSLALLIPFSLGDFLLHFVGLPVQFSGLGVLVICWLAIGLARDAQGHRATLIQFGFLLAGAAVSGGVISLLTQAGPGEGLIIFAIVAAAFFLVATVDGARSLQREAQGQGLLRALAAAPTDGPMPFIAALQEHPIVEGAVLVEGEHLAQLQQPVLEDVFAATPVLRKNDVPPNEPVAADHIAYLFDRYAATHLMYVTSKPMRLLALNMPALGMSPAVEAELIVVQRMAMLLSEQEEKANDT